MIKNNNTRKVDIVTVLTAGCLGVTIILLAACSTTGMANRGDDGEDKVSEPTTHLQASAKNVDTLQAFTERITGTTVSFEMVPIAAGAITDSSGADVPIGPFWIGATEVSWDLYDVYVFGLDRRQSAETAADAVAKPSKPYVLPGDAFGHTGLPALGMTVQAATTFATWLSEKTGKKYRLPTEEEWEYVCRMGLTEASLREVAWYWDNARDRTHPLGRLGADANGVFDILGNAAEWVTAKDGVPVIKGGSFLDEASDVHCGSRRGQTKAWNITDPQLPKSAWWLSDAPFVGMRILRDP